MHRQAGERDSYQDFFHHFLSWIVSQVKRDSFGQFSTSEALSPVRVPHARNENEKMRTTLQEFCNRHPNLRDLSNFRDFGKNNELCGKKRDRECLFFLYLRAVPKATSVD
jgi:hypothetical protein